MYEISPDSSDHSNPIAQHKIEGYALAALGGILAVTGTLALIGAINSVNAALAASLPFLAAAIAATGPAGWITLASIILLVGIAFIMSGIERANSPMGYTPIRPQNDYQQQRLDKRKELLDQPIPEWQASRIEHYEKLKLPLNSWSFNVALELLQSEDASEMQRTICELDLMKHIRKAASLKKKIPEDLWQKCETYIQNINSFQEDLNENMEWDALIPMLYYIKKDPPPQGIDPKIPELIQTVVQQKRDLGLNQDTLEKIYTSLTSKESFTTIQLTAEELELLKPQCIEKLSNLFLKLEDLLEMEQTVSR